MFRRLFKKQINSITLAAVLVAVSALAADFLGVFRDHVLAGQFGAGEYLDIYYASFRIPDLIYNLIILGALSAGFIPIFTSLIKNFSCDKVGGTGNSGEVIDPNQEAWSLASNVLNFLFVGLAGLSVIGIIFAPALTRLITPGFNPEQQKLVVSLTRIMFLSPLFLGISGVLGGILQSFKRFVMYALAPVLYNLGIIVGALFFVNWWGIYGLAWGVVLGAFLHMAIQLPTVFSLGFRYKLGLRWRDVNTIKIGRMMVPRTLSLAVAQANLVIITIIASRLSSGSLAVFNFANNLQSFPIGIFGISFAIAAFPSLAATAFDKEKLNENFSQTFRQILFFVIPATVLMLALRAQIIRVVLGAGKFNWEDTMLTMDTLGFFTLSLFAQATIPLLVRVFYARHNSVIPFVIGVITVGLNTLLAWWLAPWLGVRGLALAYSIDNILNFLLLWLALHFTVGITNIKQTVWAVTKFVLSALMAGCAAQLTKVLIWPWIDMTRFFGVLSQLLVSGVVGLAVYLGFSYLLGSEELDGFLAMIGRRLPFNKVKLDDQGEARRI